MALEFVQLVAVINEEVKDDTERQKILARATKDRELVCHYRAGDVVGVVREWLKEDTAGSLKRERESEAHVVAGEALAVAKASLEEVKRRRTSITNVVKLGEDVFERAELRGAGLLDEEGFAAQDCAILEQVAEALKDPYREMLAKAEHGDLKESDVQDFTKKLYQVLEEKAPRLNTVVADTSETGMGGGKNKMDHVICDRAAKLPHVIVVQENKPNLKSSTFEKESAGQLQQRSESVFDKQPGRGKLAGVSVGYDQIDLWIFERLGRIRHTGALALSAGVDSVGLQTLLRLWLTPNDVLGYKSPQLPASLRMIAGEGPFRKGAVINDLFRLDVGNESQTAAEVLCGTLEATGDRVALKTGAAINHEIVNTEVASGYGIEGIIKFCGVAESEDKRRWLVTTPVGSCFDEGGDASTILNRISTVASAIGSLHDKHRNLHRDISFGNLLATPDGPRIIDWHTLENLLSAPQENVQLTGTPQFMALSVLQGRRATLSSELETLLNVLAYIATGDRLHWRHELFESIGMVDAKYAGWTLHFESKMLPRIEETAYKGVLSKMQKLFFPERLYREDVKLEEFLNALQI